MKSLFLALLAIASFSDDSFGQTVINSVPYTISTPGTYTVGSNLVYPSATGAAIRIVISHVTLDLAGHYLYHPPPAPQFGALAIYVYNAMDVTIQNGIIAGFSRGVEFNYSGGIVQNLRLDILHEGIVLVGATYSKVTNNQITNAAGNLPGQFGGYGIAIYASGNVASENIISGFYFGIYAVDESKTPVSSNNYLFENTISNCSVGLYMDPGDKYRFNTTFNCGTPFANGTALASDNN